MRVAVILALRDLIMTAAILLCVSERSGANVIHVTQSNGSKYHICKGQESGESTGSTSSVTPSSNKCLGSQDRESKGNDLPALHEPKQTVPETEENYDNPSWNAISISGTRFVDSYGRQIVFNGINLVNKNPQAGYVDANSAKTFELLKGCGFNCVRLGVIWDAVEPEPGKYDEKYLDKLEQEVEWASRNGIYVVLDMHQDLYGVRFVEKGGDGAPVWATLTNNLPDSGGVVWSDSYFLSSAIQRAFDNFWANAPATDGIGIQGRYAQMWQHIAKLFANNRAVLGYDIMNEPWYGTLGKKILSLMLKEYGKLYAEETGKVIPEKELSDIWFNDEQRTKAFAWLQSSKRYAKVINAAAELCQQFDKNSLQSMYQRVANAIREVDTSHILFLEHSYLENMGISTGIRPTKLRDGASDPLVAYAGHGYDPLVDTRDYDGQSDSRVGLIFSRINAASKRIRIPLLVGEWGAFPDGSVDALVSARFTAGLFERFGIGSVYWDYHPGIEKDRFFINAIVRPYPPFIGGNLKTYDFNYETGVFKCSWEESPHVKAPTVIYIPDAKEIAKQSITLNPKGRDFFVRLIGSSEAGYLIIPFTGDSLDRTIKFKLNKF